MFTPDQIEKLLEEAKPQVIETLKNELLSAISWGAKSKCAEIIQRHVAEWVKENILPDITKHLIESKESLISIGIKVGPAITDEMAKAITKEISKNLNDTYYRRKIFRALLNSRD